MKCLVNRKELLSELKIIDRLFKQDKKRNDITNNVRVIVRNNTLILFVWRDGRMYKTSIKAVHLSFIDSDTWDTTVNIRAFKEAVDKMKSEVVELLYAVPDYTVKVTDGDSVEVLDTIKAYLYPGDIFLHTARRSFPS